MTGEKNQTITSGENDGKGKERDTVQAEKPTEQEKKPFLKAYEKDLEKRTAAAKLFSVDEFILDADKLREVYVPEIDRKVKYKKLTLTENKELTKIKDVEDRTQKLLYKVLHKADPSTTEEKVGKLGNDVSGAIMRAILEDLNFLPKRRPT